MDPQAAPPATPAPPAPEKKRQDPFMIGLAGVAALCLLGYLLAAFGGPSVRSRIPFTPESRIVGKWIGTPSPVSQTIQGEDWSYSDVPPDLEFLPDGTYIANRDDMGQYRFLDSERLTLTPPVRDGSETLVRVTFKGSAMTLKGATESLRYRRP